MIIQVDFPLFQKALKDFKAVVSKSPLAKSSEEAKDLGVLLTADDTKGQITLELAIRGFYLAAVIPGEIKDPGAAVIRVDSVTALKVAAKETTLSCGEVDKVLKLKSGRFKADIPAHHNVEDIVNGRPEKLVTTHSIHSNKIGLAINCVDLDVSKDDTLFAKFVFDSSGMTAWANSPSTAALHHNGKLAFDEKLEVTLPVDFISTYLSKVTGKVQLAVDTNVFQFTADEIEVSHPLREADVFDIKTSVEDLLSEEALFKFNSSIDPAIEIIASIISFAPEDQRMTVKIDPKKNTMTCKTSSPSGEGENSFSITDPETAKASKATEFYLNCKVVLKLLEVMKTLGVEELLWIILNDRILLQSKDSMISYICAQME